MGMSTTDDRQKFDALKEKNREKEKELKDRNRKREKQAAARLQAKEARTRRQSEATRTHVDVIGGANVWQVCEADPHVYATMKDRLEQHLSLRPGDWPAFQQFPVRSDGTLLFELEEPPGYQELLQKRKDSQKKEAANDDKGKTSLTDTFPVSAATSGHDAPESDVETGGQSEARKQG